jgi:hypothetical protein
MPEMRFHSELVIQRVPALRRYRQQVFEGAASFHDAPVFAPGSRSFQTDNFGITFPNGIDLSQKAVLLGAVFLIDFIHFENSGKKRN